MKGIHNAVEVYEVTATIRLAYTKTLLATLRELPTGRRDDLRVSAGLRRV